MLFAAKQRASFFQFQKVTLQTYLGKHSGRQGFCERLDTNDQALR